MRSAKELCALLITRGIRDLSEEEEEVVVDYLEDVGIKVDLDMTGRDLCVALLEKSMLTDLKKKVPITAYANNLLQKNVEKKVEKVEKVVEVKTESLKDKRNREVQTLEKKSRQLPGCLPSDEKLLKSTLYDFVVDEELGVQFLEDNTLQQTAAVSLSSAVYDEIFLRYENPVIELLSDKGFRAYARIVAPHDDRENVIYISSLVANILSIVGNKGAGFVKLCISLPVITKIGFTFYGTDVELQNVLKDLIEKVPNLINAFSYLSLGMVLSVNVGGRDYSLRVDSLLDSDDRPIFAGLIPSFENEIPFEVYPDM